MLDLAIVNGSVVADAGIQELDVGVSDGSIVALTVAGAAPLKAARTIDAAGCYVLPGVIDAHTHMQPRLPGDEASSFIEWVDDFTSGSISAACGGVTTFVDFAVQKQEPGASAVEVVERYRAIGEQTSVVDFGVHAGLTQPGPQTLEEIPVLAELGVPSFKFFRTYRRWGIFADLGFMYEAFGEIARVGGTACVHCEEDEILTHLRNRYIAEGRDRDLHYHALSRPAVAEEIAIDEIAALARVCGTRTYVVHLNSRLGHDAVRRAKAAGTPLEAEAGLHFLFFTDEVFEGPDAPLFFMTPPFRAAEDIEALWQGLGDGSIDWVATDHSPHLRAEKMADPRFSPSDDGLEFAIPPGFTGIEEMLPLMYTNGVCSGRFSLSRLVDLLSTNPARALGLDRKGAIALGKDADLVVYDPDGTRTVSIANLHTKSDYTIYEGMELRGRVRDTILRGVAIVREGEFLGAPGAGRFVERKPVGDAGSQADQAALVERL